MNEAMTFLMTLYLSNRLTAFYSFLEQNSIVNYSGTLKIIEKVNKYNTNGNVNVMPQLGGNFQSTSQQTSQVISILQLTFHHI